MATRMFPLLLGLMGLRSLCGLMSMSTGMVLLPSVRSKAIAEMPTMEIVPRFVSYPFDKLTVWRVRPVVVRVPV